MTSLFDAGLGWLLFGSLLLAGGSLSIRFLVLSSPEAASVDRAPLWRETASAGGVAAAVLAVALFLAFARQLQEFRDPFAPVGEDVSLLLGSAWGRAWRWSLLAAVLAGVGFGAAHRGRRLGWWLAMAGIVVASVYPGLTGHAAGTGNLRWITLTADLLHVLSASAWMGGLAVILWLEARRNQHASGHGAASLLPTLVPAFSRVAMVSVAILLTTGILASWTHLETVSSLWRTPYGRLLAGKVILVAATLGLGALNWRRLTPRLTEAGGPGAMRRWALLELALANAVLLLTAILVRTSPLGH